MATKVVVYIPSGGGEPHEIEIDQALRIRTADNGRIIIAGDNSNTIWAAFVADNIAGMAIKVVADAETADA